MSRTARGSRGSEWQTGERCHRLLLRLMKSPAAMEELLQIVIDKAAEDGKPLSTTAAIKQLQKDFTRLRTHLRCEIKCDRREKIYTLIHTERALLDLPQEALRGVAFLQSTFSDPSAPHSREVEVMLDRLNMLLPPKSVREIKNERGLLELDLRQRDSDTISEEVWEKVQTACAERRQMEVDYLSPRHEDRKPRCHLVEPYRHFFDSVHGHFYLEAYSFHATSEAHGQVEQNMLHYFRMGRILNARVLPKHFASGKRHRPKEELVYELMPEIARLGVTKHFPDSVIVMHKDGGATVHAMSANLFFDLRTLLHYGPNCRVVGGEKALWEMKSLIKAMYERYQPNP